MARALITVPPNPKRGQTIEIRALIQHPMESGFRPDSRGRVLPRNIIRKFRCVYDDGATKETVFAAELYSAVAANPFFVFSLRAEKSGTLTFTWEGDQGFSQTETAALAVT
jgi:sulfur-oxidizing protein SoxZ